jgi:methyl-accepting chemotaxis protein
VASTAEIKAQIQSAIEQADEAVKQMGAAQSQVETAIGTGAAATQDTSSSLPGEALGQWERAKERLDEAIALVLAANQSFEQYSNTI